VQSIAMSMSVCLSAHNLGKDT